MAMPATMAGPSWEELSWAAQSRPLHCTIVTTDIIVTVITGLGVADTATIVDFTGCIQSIGERYIVPDGIGKSSLRHDDGLGIEFRG